MYLETGMTAGRLNRITRRAQASIADGVAQKTAKVTAKLSARIAAAIHDADMAAKERPGERRRAARFAASAQIHARRIPGASFEVELENLSTAGCRIEMMEVCEEGEDVIARFPQLEAIGARVRWSIGRTAGLQFARPIHPAVFGSLLERLSSGLQPIA